MKLGLAAARRRSATGAPTNSVAPPATGPTVNGQRGFVGTGTWSNSPTSYSYALYDVTDLTTIVADVDNYRWQDTDIGKSFKWLVTATNGIGSNSTYSNTLGPITEIDLTADTPVLARTSSSGAAPFAFTAALGSNTYVGYLAHLQVGTDIDFNTYLYDGVIALTEENFASPFDVLWETDASPPLDQTGWPGVAFAQMRIEAETPLGYGGVSPYVSPWSNIIQKDDAAPIITAVWTATANWTRSNGNKTATYVPGSGDLLKCNIGFSASATADRWWSNTRSGSGSYQSGFANSSQPAGGYLGDGNAASIGYDWGSGAVLKNGSAVAGYNALASVTDGVVILQRIKNGNYYLAFDGVYQGGGDPVAETGGIPVGTLGTIYPAFTTGNPKTVVATFTNWA